MKALAACRPVDWSKMAALLPDMAETPIYPGSVQGVCQKCGDAVWVGPKAQEVGDAAEILCFRCAIETAAAEGGAVPLINLGNTYLPAGQPPPQRP